MKENSKITKDDLFDKDALDVYKDYVKLLKQIIKLEKVAFGGNVNLDKYIEYYINDSKEKDLVWSIIMGYENIGMQRIKRLKSDIYLTDPLNGLILRLYQMIDNGDLVFKE